LDTLEPQGLLSPVWTNRNNAQKVNEKTVLKEIADEWLCLEEVCGLME
jgi:hypothetical protein